MQGILVLLHGVYYYGNVWVTARVFCNSVDVYIRTTEGVGGSVLLTLALTLHRQDLC